MTATVAAPPVSKRRMALLVVVALALSAVAATATAVALSSRADLSASRRQVDVAWSALRPSLDARYTSLGQAAGVARESLKADRAVFGDIARAVTDWPGTERLPTDRQVAAAAHLEGLVARLSATVSATPRLRAAAEVAAALRPLEQSDTAQTGAPYNTAVKAYQKARGGFPRSLVAGALGYDDRRTLEVPA